MKGLREGLLGLRFLLGFGVFKGVGLRVVGSVRI